MSTIKIGNPIFNTPAAKAAQEARWKSKAGDPRRQGRALTTPAPRELVVFVDTKGRVDARIGAITVGMITLNPTGGRLEYIWAVDLAGFPRVAQPAADLDKAKSAILHKVRAWCEAAGLVKRGVSTDVR